MTAKDNKSNLEQSLTKNEEISPANSAENSQDEQVCEKTVKKKKTYRKRDKTKPKERTYGILIVEDEKSWTNVYKINLIRKLEKKRKFRIYEAKNSKEAIKILIQYNDRIDIVILDLVIGEQTADKPEGMLLLETIVDRLGLTDIGIFVITAYGTQAIEEQCHIRGVRYFLDKSQLDFEKLSKLIDDYLDLIDKPKGTDVGFYIESRSQKEQRYLYLRWKYSEGNWDSEYLGNAKEIERIILPNIITNLNELEGWKPVDEDIDDQ
jgi:CheY-like chemotaxis protein